MNTMNKAKAKVSVVKLGSLCGEIGYGVKIADRRSHIIVFGAMVGDGYDNMMDAKKACRSVASKINKTFTEMCRHNG